MSTDDQANAVETAIAASQVRLARSRYRSRMAILDEALHQLEDLNEKGEHQTPRVLLQTLVNMAEELMACALADHLDAATCIEVKPRPRLWRLVQGALDGAFDLMQGTKDARDREINRAITDALVYTGRQE